MFLLDSNIWLERLLDQARSAEVNRFLNRVPSSEITITDFSLYSIGIILTNLDKPDALKRFVTDTLLESRVSLIRLKSEDVSEIVRFIKKYRMDFDDAYQYVAAENYNLTIVSFDNDFDRTERGRKTPKEVLQE